MRMGAEESPGVRCAFVEYTTASSFAAAMTCNGSTLNGRIIRFVTLQLFFLQSPMFRAIISNFFNRVVPSQTAISKSVITAPQSSSVNPKEMDEAMRKLKEASSLISGTVDSGEIRSNVVHALMQHLSF